MILGPIRPGEFPYSQHRMLLVGLKFENESGILFIDQLEELITICRNDDERNQFEAELVELSRKHKIVCTLRSDLESNLKNGMFLKHTNPHRFFVPPFTREEIGQIVIQPAMQQVLEFKHSISKDDETFVNGIIDEAFRNSASLPMLSLALSELFQKREDNLLLERVYKQFGGLVGILETKSNDLFKVYSVRKQQLFRFLIFRAISFESGAITKRRIYKERFVTGKRAYRELEFEDPADNKLIEEIVDDLTSQSRLFNSGTDASGNYIEPVHDRFLESWSLLNDWLKVNIKGELSEPAKISLNKELSDDVFKYYRQLDGRAKTNELWTANSQLDEVAGWIYTPRLNRQERDFVFTSIQERQRQRRARTHRLYGTIIALSSLLVLAGVLWYRSNRAAARNRALYLNSVSQNLSASQRMFYLTTAYDYAPKEDVIVNNLVDLANANTSVLFPFAEAIVYNEKVSTMSFSSLDGKAICSVMDSSIAVRDSSLQLQYRILAKGMIMQARPLPDNVIVYSVFRNKICFTKKDTLFKKFDIDSSLSKENQQKLNVALGDLTYLDDVHQVVAASQVFTNPEIFVLHFFDTKGRLLNKYVLNTNPGPFLAYVNKHRHELYYYDSKLLVIFNYLSKTWEAHTLQPPTAGFSVSFPVFTFSPDGQLFFYKPPFQQQPHLFQLSRKADKFNIVATPKEISDIKFISDDRLLVCYDSVLLITDTGLNVIRSKKFDSKIANLIGLDDDHLLFAGEIGGGGYILDSMLAPHLLLERNYTIGTLNVSSRGKLHLTSQYDKASYIFDLHKKNEIWSYRAGTANTASFLTSQYVQLRHNSKFLCWRMHDKMITIYDVTRKKDTTVILDASIDRVIVNEGDDEIFVRSAGQTYVLSPAGSILHREIIDAVRDTLMRNLSYGYYKGRKCLVSNKEKEIYYFNTKLEPIDSIHYPSYIFQYYPNEKKGMTIVSDSGRIEYRDSTGRTYAHFSIPDFTPEYVGGSNQHNLRLKDEKWFYLKNGTRYFTFASNGRILDSGYIVHSQGMENGLTELDPDRYIYHASAVFQENTPLIRHNELWRMHGALVHDFMFQSNCFPQFFTDQQVLFQNVDDGRIFTQYIPSAVTDSIQRFRIRCNKTLEAL